MEQSNPADQRDGDLEWRDKILIGLAFVLVVVHVAASVRSARRKCGELRAALPAWASGALRATRGADGRGPSEKLVARELREVTVQRARILFDVMRYMYTANFLTVLLYFLTYGQYPYVRTFFADWLRLVAFSSLMLVRVFPRLLNGRTVICWFCWQSSLVVASLMHCNCLSILAYQGRLCMATSILLSLGCDKMFFVLLANVAVAMSRTYWCTEFQRDDRWTMLHTECASAAMATAIAYLLHWLTLARIRVTLAGQALRDEGRAMTRLLEMMCDAVVELDGMLRITEPAPHLAAILRLDTERCVQGERFQDFMSSDEDKARVASRLMASPEDSEAFPNVMHATMKGPGTTLNVEIFFVRFPGLGGEGRLLVGFREAVDQPIADLGKVKAKQRDMSRRMIMRRRASAPATISTNDDFPASPTSSLQCDSRSSCGGSRVPSVPDVPASHDYQRRLGSRVMRRREFARAALGCTGLADPAFRATSRRAKDESLLRLLARWNVSMPVSACCFFHTYLQEATDICQRLCGRTCSGDVLCDVRKTQCIECGIFADSPSSASEAIGPCGAWHCEICCPRAVKANSHGRGAGAACAVFAPSTRARRVESL